MNLYFSLEFRRCLDLLSASIGLRTCSSSIPNENTKNKPPSLTFSKIPRTWSFHVVVLEKTAKKCTKNYNARAQLLFYSLNLLFCGVLVAVAVVVCLRSLIQSSRRAFQTVSYGRPLPREFTLLRPGEMIFEFKETSTDSN